jgi:hypothetical protein
LKILPVEEDLSNYTKSTTTIIEHEKNFIIEKKTSKQYLAFIYINNADQAKYRTIMARSITQQSLGNDQYLRTIWEVTSVLSNHQFDYSTPKSINRNIKNKTENKPQEQINLSFAQIEEGATAVVRQNINHHNASTMTNQRLNGLSTNTKATSKQAKQKIKSKNQQHQKTTTRNHSK